MATIGDVARAARVSRTAVSFAFNDPSRLSPETLARILSIAHDLGYYPSPVARSLTSKRIGAIGLLIPHGAAVLFANPFFAELLRGVGRACDRQDLAVLLVPPVQGSVTRALDRAAADGFVVVGLDEDHPALAMLRQRNLPFITVDGPALPQISSVNVDDEQGAYLAAAHLLALGHRDLLIIRIRPAVAALTDGGARAFSGVTARRLAGYRRAFAAAGAAFHDGAVVAAEGTRAGGAGAFREAWRAARRPTAVLAMSDIIALGAMDAARALGLAVPDQLSIAGFDDIPEAQWCEPALTTVRQSGLEKGECAARLLVARQSGAAAEHLLLPTSLIVRGSSAPPARAISACS